MNRAVTELRFSGTTPYLPFSPNCREDIATGCNYLSTCEDSCASWRLDGSVQPRNIWCMCMKHCRCHGTPCRQLVAWRQTLGLQSAHLIANCRMPASRPRAKATMPWPPSTMSVVSRKRSAKTSGACDSAMLVTEATSCFRAVPAATVTGNGRDGPSVVEPCTLPDATNVAPG
jgi:hypothetical protein